ncbi:MAG: phage tail protein [Desulfovibrio sp.]
MGTCITIDGENIIAAKQAAGEALVIDKFILANVPGLDPTAAMDRTEGKPAAEHIVYEYDIPLGNVGYVNPNQVVYSMILGSDVGPFSFNWLGLYSSANDKLVAITHLPTTDKIKSDLDNQISGNNLSRNFLLEFSGAQEIADVTVEAGSWQIDFTSRLNGIDKREQESNRDIYGNELFWKRGFEVVKNGDKYEVSAGSAYVQGIRITTDKVEINPPLNTTVNIDVALVPSGSDVVAETNIIMGSKPNYTDGGIFHYVIPLADIDGAGVITDRRRVEDIADNLVDWIKATASDAQTLGGLGVQTTPLDTEHEIMRVGGFGWGDTAPNGAELFSNNFNTFVLADCVVTISAAWENGPLPTGKYMGLLFNYARCFDNFIYQKMVEKEQTFARTGDPEAGIWGPWRKIFESGNDGHNSGLDADLLDGHHASQFGALAKVGAWTRQQYTPLQMIQDQPTIEWDLDQSPTALIILEGNRTLSLPTNFKEGGQYQLMVRQDSMGGRTLAFESGFYWPDGKLPELSMAPDSNTILTFFATWNNMFGVATRY